MKCLLPTTALLVMAVLLPVVVRGQDPSEPPTGMNVLEKLVGTWKFKDTKGQSRTLKRELVLDGHFVQSKVFNDQGKLLNIKMYAYDAKKKAYRNWWFIPGGGVKAPVAMEFAGTWDESSQTLTFTWKEEGFSVVTTTRFLDEKTWAVTVVAKDAGKVVNRTEGKAIRQE